MKAIVAMDLNRVIGNKGKLPWYIPDDLKWFRKCTWNNIIVVGWNTFRDLPPLPNREIEVVDFGTGDIDSQPITNFNGVFGRISKLQKEFPPKPSHFDPLFGKDSSKQAQWQAFVKKTRLSNAPGEFNAVLTDMKMFLGPLITSLVDRQPFHGKWKASGPWI